MKSKVTSAFLFLRFFWWTFFKVLNLLQCCSCFIFCIFGQEACGILAPQPGIEPAPPALKGEVSTPGAPRKSNHISIKCLLFKLSFLFKSPIQIPAPEKYRGKQVAVQFNSSAQLSHTAPVVAAAFFTVLHTKCTFNSFLSSQTWPYSWRVSSSLSAVARLQLPQISKFSSVQLLSHVWLFVTPWTAAGQAPLSITNSQSLLKLMSIESVMSSNHLILNRSEKAGPFVPRLSDRKPYVLTC